MACIDYPLAYVENPKGTIYWGGSGLGGDYVQLTVHALNEAGIRHISVGRENTASRHLGDHFRKVGTLVDAIRAGVVLRRKDDGRWVFKHGMRDGNQLNLIGYSYGSLLAAQTANFYATSGVTVDNLVLIGSPISAEFLKQLKNSNRITKVSVIDVEGDDIHAGIGQLDLMRPRLLMKLMADMAAGRGDGHFYYGHTTPDLPSRLRLLAEKIKAAGLE